MTKIKSAVSNDVRLVIVAGLPGSGKTTLAVKLEKKLSACRFSADDWMSELGFNLWDGETRAKIEAMQWDLSKQFLRSGRSVVVEWGSWSKAERDQLRKEARSIGVKVDLYFLDDPVDVLFERIAERGLEEPPISRDDLEEWSNKIERPTIEEANLFDFCNFGVI